MMKSLTIKSRLFIAIFAILACSYALLFISSLISIQRFTEEEFAKNLQTSLKFAKSQFNTRPEIVMEALKLPVSSIPVQTWFMTNDVERLRDAAGRWNKSLDFLEIVTLVDTQQKVIARNNPKGSGKSFLQGHLLKSLFERRQPFVTTELVSHDDYCREIRAELCQALPGDKDLMVQLVFLPVLSGDGKLLGAIVAGDDVNQESYLPYQQQNIFGKTVEMMITQMGERIASTTPASDGLSSNLDSKVLQSLKSGFSFNGSTVLSNRDYEMIAEPILNHKGEFIGSIAVALEKGEFSGVNNENLKNLILCALFSIPLIIVMAYWIARQFALPMRNLMDAINGVESGDFSSRLKESGSREFRVLYENFNRMTKALSERDEMIISRNSELQRSNEELQNQVLERGEQLKSETATIVSILKSLSDGVLVTDEDRKIILMNPAAEKLLGGELREMSGVSASAIFEALQMHQLAMQLGNVQDIDGDAVYFAQHRGRRLRITVSPLLYDGWGRQCFLLCIRDISREGEVDRLKSDFIATVSHELKTPLTSMKGSLQFILKKGKWLTGVEREMLSVCERNTERLISLISSILEISRIEAGQEPFAMKPVSLGELAIYVLEEMKAGALSRNISFVNNVSFDLPQVLGDSGRLHQVLSNLLSNAVKFSPADSVVTLLAERQGGYVALSVYDDGKVIKPSDRDRLFTKFQRFSPPEDGDPGGSGLGLAICREIMEKHGGSIYYSPGVAGGNIFTFTVPIYGEHDGQE